METQTSIKDRQFPAVVFYLLAVFTLLSILAVYFALKPAFSASFDLTSPNAANIGAAIGGITSPIIALFSSMLLFFTLYEQIKANDAAKKAESELRERNSADTLFLLYNQLEIELRELSATGRRMTSVAGAKDLVTEHYYGYDALSRLCGRLSGAPQLFGSHIESNKVLYLIQSYAVIAEHLKESRLSESLERAISAKLTNFYITKLRDPLRNLCFGIRHNPDKTSKEVLDFFITLEQRSNPGFDLYSFESREDLLKD